MLLPCCNVCLEFEKQRLGSIKPLEELVVTGSLHDDEKEWKALCENRFGLTVSASLSSSISSSSTTSPPLFLLFLCLLLPFPLLLPPLSSLPSISSFSSSSPLFLLLLLLPPLSSLLFLLFLLNFISSHSTLLLCQELPSFYTSISQPWKKLYVQYNLQELVSKLNDNPDFKVLGLRRER